MGIELPPELADVAAKTGVKWPAADEDKLREAAQAWRDTGQKLTTLIGEADTSAQAALHTTRGAGADAAKSHWTEQVKPDTGHLTSVAKGCTDAADRLDHAAHQVGEAKLAIVRNLVPLAKNTDVANHAAAAGHPTALLGLDTAVKGTAANVANVHHTLVTAVQPTSGVVVDATQTLVDPNPGGHGHSPNLPHDPVGHVTDAAGNLVQDTGHPGKPGHDMGNAIPATGDVIQNPDHGPFGPGIEPTTGPIAVPGSPGFTLPHDAPTPPAGFPIPHDQVHVASAAPAVLDGPVPAQAAPPPVSQGMPAPPPPGGGTPFGGGAPAAPVIGGPPPAAPVAPVAGQPVSAQPSPLPPQQRGQAPVFVPGDTGRPAPDQVRQPGPVPVVTPSPAPQQDHEAILAIWLVRMFPIGHMPVARDRPAHQLPAPSPDYDYAPGMRFEPWDHPSSGLIETSRGRAEPSEPEEDAIVDGLAVGYDPLGGENERDWDRRFVVRPGSGRDSMDIEYAWPPGELFPEGATDDGEAELLAPGTVIDRFGTEEGRVFAAESTAFTRRSLPPSHLRAGYRRYRVLRPLPVWRAMSAAWFAQSGGGVRYRTVYPALDLVAFGYLAEEIDTEESVDEG